jgi:hypothetical protein
MSKKLARLAPIILFYLIETRRNDINDIISFGKST